MHEPGRHHPRRLAFALAVAAGIVLTPGVPGRASAQPARAATVWLCRPGLAHDPCTADLTSTTVRADGSTTITRAAPASSSPFDCFYVYPTVSQEQTLNADLTVQPAEIAVAVAQASRFSQVCRVWAPMYRQRTLLALAYGQFLDPRNVAYQSLLAGWRDYLAHENGGRPIIFIGHSQGASLLITLLHNEIDGNPALRARMVSAIILGGNVTVPTAGGGRGSFTHIPACRAAGQFGCVIAYSSYPGQPPPNSLFGRAGQGVSLLAGQTATAGVRVLCVNPVVMGGAGPLDAYFPTADLPGLRAAVRTPWVEFPDLYRAACRSAQGATWLDVTRTGAPRDTRPRVQQTGGAIWGYHVADVNLALGDLVSDVRLQERAYQIAAR